MESKSFPSLTGASPGFVMLDFELGAETCDCGLPLDLCQSGGSDDDGFDDADKAAFFAFLDDVFGDADEAGEPDPVEINKFEALANLGRILEDNSAAVATYTDLIAKTFGGTKN